MTDHSPVPTVPPEAEDPGEPVRYIERTRAYYRALGYPPYRWARADGVPFTPLARPLSEARLALVTTAAPHRPDLGDQGPGAPYNGAAKYHEVFSAPTASAPVLRISHLGYDRTHTAADDQNTYFPLARLREAAAAGRFGGLAPRYHGLPTTRSQRATRERDAPALLDRVREDGAHGVLLVAS